MKPPFSPLALLLLLLGRLSSAESWLACSCIKNQALDPNVTAAVYNEASYGYKEPTSGPAPQKHGYAVLAKDVAQLGFTGDWMQYDRKGGMSFDGKTVFHHCQDKGGHDSCCAANLNEYGSQQSDGCGLIKKRDGIAAPEGGRVWTA